jgi:hypothetical protein
MSSLMAVKAANRAGEEDDELRVWRRRYTLKGMVRYDGRRVLVRTAGGLA